MTKTGNSAIFGGLLTVAVLLTAMASPQAGAQAPGNDPYASWGRVLGKFVDDQGATDFHALENDRSDLDAFLDYIARVSPQAAPDLFPTRESRLAYYINAYNALAMHNVIDSGIPDSLTGLSKVWFFGFKRFTVGGKKMSLYTLENDIIRPLGDERVHFALNCMAAGCPRLPRVPFGADQIDRQLDAETRRFFSESRNLRVMPDERRVRVSSLLEFYTGDFLNKADSLIAYINQYVTQPIPVGYEIGFIDYDWAVNVQHRTPERRQLR